MKKLVLVSSFLAGSLILTAQRSIVVIGSSTAWGKGSTPGHSWVSLTSAWLKSQGLIDTIYNLAIPGYTTWKGVPAGTPIPAASDSTDPKRNVTRALGYRPLPKMVIVSYPSNDITDGFTVAQYLANLRLIYNTVLGAGSQCFISTTQPTDNKNPAIRSMLKIAADSIRQEYPGNSFDFYDTAVNHSTGADSLEIKSNYSYGDGIHMNDSGHLALFEQVKASQSFLSALTLNIGRPALKVVSTPALEIDWQAAHADSPVQFFIQRGPDSLHFVDIGEVNGVTSVADHGYSFTDTTTASGASFYRIHAVEYGKDYYSDAVSYYNSGKSFGLMKLYSDPGTPSVVAEIVSQKTEPMVLLVYNISGRLIFAQQINVMAPSTRQTIYVPGLSAGVYYVKLSDGTGQHDSRAFVKF